MIEEWRRWNIEKGLRALRLAEAEAGHWIVRDAISFIEAALMDGPDNYETLRSLPYAFIAEFEGRTVRCYKAEHANIGRGWMLSVDGVDRVVSEREITNPRIAD